MCLGKVAPVNSLAEGSYTMHGISFFCQIKVIKTENSVSTQVTVNTKHLEEYGL